MKVSLFVYGTLMRGESQAGLLGRARRSQATTRGTLWNLPAGYPALAITNAGEDDIVHGELVELADPRMLEVIDAYEGVGEGLYTRTQVDVRIGLRTERAWTYVMSNPSARGGRQVSDGRWKPIRSR